MFMSLNMLQAYFEGQGRRYYVQHCATLVGENLRYSSVTVPKIIIQVYALYKCIVFSTKHVVDRYAKIANYKELS